MIQVFHTIDPTFGRGPDPVWPDEYDHVANVDVPDGEHHRVFKLTNHIDRSWQENDGVTPVGEAISGARSTSVGDVIVLSDGRVMRCARVGWKEIGNVVDEGLNWLTQGGAK